MYIHVAIGVLEMAMQADSRQDGNIMEEEEHFGPQLVSKLEVHVLNEAENLSS